MSPDGPGSLPALVLRCRLFPRLLHVAAALYFLGTGTVFLARGAALPGSAWTNPWIWRGAIGLLVGSCAAWYAARYGFARLVLDDHGFALDGPLGETRVGWREVHAWRRRPPAGGPFPNILLVYGESRRRLFVPLIYEESHALEVGLAQQGFPKY